MALTDPRTNRGILKIPFITSTYSGRSKTINSQKCVNLYPELDQDNTVSSIYFYGTPGTRYITTIGVGPIRGMLVSQGIAYVVSGSKLLSYTAGGVKTELGTLSTSSGPVSLAHNGVFGGQIVLVDGTSGYLYDSDTAAFSTLGSPFPSDPEYVVFVDGYFVVVRGDTNQFYRSALYDGSSWSALNYASAERSPDNLRSLAVSNRFLWLLGDETTELWFNDDSDFAFSPVSSGVIERGIAAPHSVAVSESHVLWLSKTNNGANEVVMAIESDYRTISPPSIIWQFNQYSTVSDAIGYIYEEEGHTFYVLTFPSANKTWVYDISMNMWHERATGTGRHVGNAYMYFNDMHIVGDYQSGNIYQLDMDTYTDNGDEIIRILTSQAIVSERNNVLHRKLELEAETGVGLLTGQGSDPQIALDWSDDGGFTHGNKIYTDYGAIGEYGKRITWPGLGASRSRIYRLTSSEPVKHAWANLYLDVEECAY